MKFFKYYLYGYLFLVGMQLIAMESNKSMQLLSYAASIQKYLPTNESNEVVSSIEIEPPKKKQKKKDDNPAPLYRISYGRVAFDLEHVKNLDVDFDKEKDYIFLNNRILVMLDFATCTFRPVKFPAGIVRCVQNRANNFRYVLTYESFNGKTIRKYYINFAQEINCPCLITGNEQDETQFLILHQDFYQSKWKAFPRQREKEQDLSVAK